MRHQKRPLLLLIFAVISLLALIYLISFISPDATIPLPGILSMLPQSLSKFLLIPPLILFFIVLAIFLFSLCSYLFKSKAHGFLIAGFVVTYLLFRVTHLTHPFFLILLLALFFVLELFVSSRNGSKL